MGAAVGLHMLGHRVGRGLALDLSGELHVGVEQERPGQGPATLDEGRERVLQITLARVQHQDQIVVVLRPTLLVGGIETTAGHEHPQAGGSRIAPVFVGHPLAIVTKPSDVAHADTMDLAALEEVCALNERMLPPQPDEIPREFEQHRALVVAIRLERPIEPGERVVLAVGVVVALLGAADLVSGTQHRGALREQQGRQEIALLPAAHGANAGIVGLALDAAIRRQVVVGPVAVVLAVGLVVLVLVGDQIAQGEPVVGRDEIDAGRWVTAPRPVEVRATGEPVSELGGLASVPPPEGPDDVAVLPVPLGPVQGKAPDLVATRADVPGLGDELAAADHGVLPDHREEARELIPLVLAARQGRGQVEPEAIHVHLGRPGAQRVHHQPERLRMASVQRIAGAGVVEVVAGTVLGKAVVGGIVDAAKAEGGPELIAFGGVVVDHVEDDLEPGHVQRLHHLLELHDVRPRFLAGAVTGVGGKVGDGVVAPVIAKLPVEEKLVVDEAVDRHQLDGGDPQLPQVAQDRLAHDAEVRPLLLRRHTGVGLGEAADVGLVDDRPAQRIGRKLVVSPIESRIGHQPARRAELVDGGGSQIPRLVVDVVGEAAI